MDVNIVDIAGKRHLRINSPVVELFERSDDDDTCRLQLDVLLDWAKKVNEKNSQFSIITILVGVAFNYYTTYDFGDKLKISWKSHYILVEKDADYINGITKVMRSTSELLRRYYSE